MSGFRNQSKAEDSSEGGTPSSREVLDSVFSKKGPLPPASIWLRALAFTLDFILVSAVASLIIWKMVIPTSHPAAFAELREWTSEVLAWMQSDADKPMPTPSRSLQEALSKANELQLIGFWLYFALSEAFFAGSSLGKRICRIRSVSTVTLGRPPILTGIVRGGLKTLLIYLLFPVLLIATLVPLFLNKRRQMGHDLLSRTAVIDEKLANF